MFNLEALFPLAYVVLILQEFSLHFSCEQAISDEWEDSVIHRKLKATCARMDQKLLWIPIVFFLIRVGGNVRFFISAPPMICPSENRCNLLNNEWLMSWQSIGDPGQGWSNALLFIVFQPTIFKRLCPCLHYGYQRVCDGVSTLPRRRRYGGSSGQEVATMTKQVDVVADSNSEHDYLIYKVKLPAPSSGCQKNSSH